MRAVPRFLIFLLVAAAAAAAVLAHAIIDVVADYAVAHASYDDVASHDSRGIVVAVAIVAAGLVAMRGFRLCCDAAARRGVRAPAPPRWTAVLPFSAIAVALASIAVPAMECVDTLLAGQPLGNLGDAFGGSVALGLAITIPCALGIAIATFALARALLSYRDRIIAAIVACVFKAIEPAPVAARLRAFGAVPIRRRSVASMRRGKRGPPLRVVSSTHNARTTLRGSPCSIRYSAYAVSS